MISQERNHLCLYPYLDYQSQASFTYRSAPGSKGQTLNLQILSWFVTGGVAADYTLQGRYNNAALLNTNTVQNNAISEIELINDGLNVLQRCAPDSFQCAAFVEQNMPYERIDQRDQVYYRDMLYHSFAIPLKFFKGGNIYDGVENVTTERSLAFNPPQTVAAGQKYTFFLMSLYSRMLVFDESGSVRLI